MANLQQRLSELLTRLKAGGMEQWITIRTIGPDAALLWEAMYAGGFLAPIGAKEDGEWPEWLTSRLCYCIPIMQRQLGVASDGGVGPETVEALLKVLAEPKEQSAKVEFVPSDQPDEMPQTEPAPVKPEPARKPAPAKKQPEPPPVKGKAARR